MSLFTIYDKASGRVVSTGNASYPKAQATESLGVLVGVHVNPSTHCVNPATRDPEPLVAVDAELIPVGGTAPLVATLTLGEDAHLSAPEVEQDLTAGTHTLTFVEAGTYEVTISAPIRLDVGWTVEVA